MKFSFFTAEKNLCKLHGHEFVMESFLQCSLLSSIENEDYIISCTYCKFRNFCVTFISQIFFFQIIWDVLNLRMSVCLVFMAYRDSLLARTFNLRGNKLANIRKN